MRRRIMMVFTSLAVALVLCVTVAGTAYADGTRLVRKDDGYSDAKLALGGYWGYSPADAASRVGRTSWDGYNNYEIAAAATELADDGYWYYSGTDVLLADAKAEFEGTYTPNYGGGGGHSIGDDSGGGGAGHSFDTIDDYHIITGGSYGGNVYTLERFRGDPFQDSYVSETAKANMTDLASKISAASTSGKDVCIIGTPRVYGSWNVHRLACAVFMLPAGVYPVNDGDGGRLSIYNSTDETVSIECYSVSTNRDDRDAEPDGDGVFKYVHRYYTTVSVNAKSLLGSYNEFQRPYSSYPATYVFFHGTDETQPEPTDPSGGGGEDPSGGGDDEPEAPTPPEIDPKEYTTYTTNNTDIDVNVTFSNDGGETDLTPITMRLDRIYERLGDIGTDLLNFDQHMQNEFYTLRNALDGLFSSYFGSVNNWLQLIYSRLEDINRNIGLLDKSTDDLTDLSGVQLSLAQILQTLQGMGNNSPAADPTDLTGVMRELSTIEDLLRGIKNPFTPVLPPVVIDDDNPIEKQVTDKGSELSRHFPFSIPWDIYGMLALFVAEPVAPEFDIPVFGMEDDIHVDLSGWDTVASVSRSATFVLFALGLALRTKDMIWKD